MTLRDYLDWLRAILVSFVLTAVALPFLLAGLDWLWDSWRNR